MCSGCCSTCSPKDWPAITAWSPTTPTRLIAGWDDPRRLEPPRQADGSRDLRRLAGLLNAPLALVELAKDATPVYHLAISAAKDPDTGAPRVRWVAVRLALDHIHAVLATLARQDGKRVWPYRDFLRSREASHAVEARYGLISSAPADRTGTPESTRAEHRRLADVNAERAEGGLPAQPAPDRDVLRRQVRTALAGSDNLEQFLDLLLIDGVLVRERFSTLNPMRSPGTPSRCRTGPTTPSRSGSGAPSSPPTSRCRTCNAAGTRCRPVWARVPGLRAGPLVTRTARRARPLVTRPTVLAAPTGSRRYVIRTSGQGSGPRPSRRPSPATPNYAPPPNRRNLAGRHGVPRRTSAPT